jgi:hypothetical protein
MTNDEMTMIWYYLFIKEEEKTHRTDTFGVKDKKIIFSKSHKKGRDNFNVLHSIP